jgi:succinoglycan biosynthesis protein ExoL
MLKILYLVHNVSDPAVERRRRMLELGGAAVAVAGFHRGDEPPAGLGTNAVSVLGKTADGRFAQRLSQVVASTLRGAPELGGSPADIVIARNLEMLPLAWRLSRRWGGIPLVYESLDIHRLLLRRDIVGGTMRAAERWLAAGASALITSSPAFVREYFAPYRQIRAPTWIIENKVLSPSGKRGANPALLTRWQTPIRIGWFGALRCRRSLDLLTGILPGLGGRFELVMRGRPALSEFDDFHAKVSVSDHVRFEGAYKAAQLPEIYSEVHLCWAIDFFEEGANSRWLLPNRIYEGCLNGAVPIALAGTETARFLQEKGVGIILPDADPATVTRILDALDDEALRRHAQAVAALPEADFRLGLPDCRELVERLSQLRAFPVVALESA